MAVYNKLFTKILDSSIWLASDTTRIVWITLIAAMDEDGFCPFATVDNLAARARVELKAAKKAVAELESVEPATATQDDDGRRIERVPGGWIVLNAAKYRRMVTRVVVREQTRERVRKHRASKRAVTQCNALPLNVTPSEAVSEADAKAGGEGNAPSDSEMIVWEGRSYYPSALREMKKDVQEQIHGAEGDELKFLSAKLKSLRIAMGTKFPKDSVRSVPKLEIVRPPLTPEERKILADALHASAENGG